MMQEFGELRSILQTSRIKPEHVHRVWTLIQELSRDDMDLYLDSVPQYIAAYSHLFSGFSLGVCHSIAQLEDSIQLAPPAYFTLELDDLNVLNELSVRPSLKRVISLKINGSAPHIDPLTNLFASSYLTSMESLSIKHVMYDTDPFMELLALERPAQITSLTISQCQLFPELIGDGSTALELSPLLAGLRVLDLSHNLLLDNCISRWITHPSHSASCESLDISHNLVSNDVLSAFAASPHMSALNVLNLSANIFNVSASDESEDINSYMAFLNSPCLAQLTDLNLSGHPSFIDLIKSQADRFPDLTLHT